MRFTTCTTSSVLLAIAGLASASPVTPEPPNDPSATKCAAPGDLFADSGDCFAAANGWKEQAVTSDEYTNAGKYSRVHGSCGIIWEHGGNMDPQFADDFGPYVEVSASTVVTNCQAQQRGVSKPVIYDSTSANVLVFSRATFGTITVYKYP